MSTVLSIKELEKKTKEFGKLNSISEIVKNLKRSEIPEEVLLYSLEVKGNRHKIKSIEKFDSIYENKEIRKTEFKPPDFRDTEARKEMCRIFKVTFENKVSCDVFKNTRGILNEYINNKIDPVELVRDIRES